MACVRGDPAARVYFVVGVGVEQEVPGVSATYCEVYATCGPYPTGTNLDHEWSWVGVWVVLILVLLSCRPSRK